MAEINYKTSLNARQIEDVKMIVVALKKVFPNQEEKDDVFEEGNFLYRIDDLRGGDFIENAMRLRSKLDELKSIYLKAAEKDKAGAAVTELNDLIEEMDAIIANAEYVVSQYKQSGNINFQRDRVLNLSYKIKGVMNKIDSQINSGGGKSRRRRRHHKRKTHKHKRGKKTHKRKHKKTNRRKHKSRKHRYHR